MNGVIIPNLLTHDSYIMTIFETKFHSDIEEKGTVATFIPTTQCKRAYKDTYKSKCRY